MRKLWVLILCQTLLSVAGAQSAPMTTLRIGAGLTANAGSNDLTYKSASTNRFWPGMNFSLQFRNKKRISPQLNMGFGRFISQNRSLPAVEGYDLNRFTETSFFYGGVRLKVNFIREKMIRPYASLGPEIYSFTPKDAGGNVLADNFDSRKAEETYSSVAFSFPLSVGVDFCPRSFMGLGLEYTYRPTTSDYLDNIGLLGSRKGKDKMHTFQASIFFLLDPEAAGARRGARTKERQPE